MKLYALHDRKAKAFSSFHVERSDVTASRGFVDAVMQKDSVFSKYPDDFELVSLCTVSQEYDELPGFLPVEDVHFAVVITAAQVLAAQPKSEQLQLLKEA